MPKGLKWLLAGLAAVLFLLGAAVVALGQWANSNDFRARAQQAATKALGVPVQLGRVGVTVWPLPGVEVRDIRIQTKPALTLERVEARPVWTSLLTGRPQLDALVVRNATLPQQGLLALAAAAQKQDQAQAGAGASKPAAKPAPGSSAMPALPRRILLEKVTWVDAKGRPLTADAEVLFAGEPLPQSLRAEIVGGRYAGAKLRLEQQAKDWQLRADIGGGTITGPLRLQPVAGGGSRLSGEFAIDRVEVSALTAPSKSLTGRLEARTTLQAEFREPAGMIDALRTQTRFTVRQAVLNGIDLAQAVRTLGVSRSGQTSLDTLTGQVSTQGRVIQLTNLVANSGSLSANGNVTMAADQSLSGRVNVDIGQIAGMPLQVGGTLDAPSATPAGLSLPGSQAAGEIGDKLSKGIKGLFGR